MLSGISHDLRTPLTRLKLQLALLKQQDLAKKMSDDIEEMERMLNEYLEFSRHQKSEDTEIVNLNNLIKDIIKKYDGKPNDHDSHALIVWTSKKGNISNQILKLPYVSRKERKGKL